MRQQKTPGAIFIIQLPCSKFGYGRILSKATYAFYDFFTDKKCDDITGIIRTKVLFILSVYDFAITKGRWIKIGKLPLEPSFETLPLQFIQDRDKPSDIRIYDPNTGQDKEATYAECIGLERASVWSGEQVEGRICDYLNGLPNKILEVQKIIDPKAK